MNHKKIYRRIVFFSSLSYEMGSFGDAINDKKLFDAIPSKFNKYTIHLHYFKNNKPNIKSLLILFFQYIKECFTSYNIIITRGAKRAFLPILFKKLLKNKIILRLGCTPLSFVEKKAFSKNIEYNSNNSILKKYLNYIEPIIEKFALRNADKYIVENSLSKKIILNYGAKLENISIIPYYIQEYFLNGKNPSFNKEFDVFKIGYTGRFKKYDLLAPIIDAISSLKREGYHIRLYLIGNGPKQKNIKKLVKERNLSENILFLGSKSHDVVSQLINDYHCLLFPMLNNICPSTVAIKILEGVMKRKIIITTNSGNNVSLFMGHSNLILQETTDRCISNKIKLVIENYDYYLGIAEEIGSYQSKFRSKKIYKNRIKQLLVNTISNKIE